MAFRAAATATVDEGTSLTIAKPAGTLADDIMLAHLTFIPDGADPGTVTPPAGWTLISSAVTGFEITTEVYWALGSATALTWTWTTTSDCAGQIKSYSGRDTAAPIDVFGFQQNPLGTLVGAPDITTLTANVDLVFLGGAKGNTARTFTPPTGMTERTDFGTTGALGGAWEEGADEVFVGPGATGTRTATVTVASINIAHLVALKPAAAPTAQIPPRNRRAVGKGVDDLRASYV